MRTFGRLISGVVAALTLTGCLVGNPTSSQRLTARRVPAIAPAATLAYGSDPQQVLDVYRPNGWQAGDSRPAVVFVHGGGWASGGRADLSPAVKSQLRRGWVVLSIDYRLSDRVDWPLPVQDVDRAVRYVRANAGLIGIDPRRIVVAGHSAGAQLVLAQGLGQGEPSFVAPDLPADLARVSSRPDAIVDISGPVDLRLWVDQNWNGAAHVLNLLLGCDNSVWGSLACTEEQVASLSVNRLLDASDPPLLIVHGVNDDVVSPVQALTLYGRAAELGLTNRVWLDVVDTGRVDQRGHFNDYALNLASFESFLDMATSGLLA